jgi:hypothetical protein
MLTLKPQKMLSMILLTLASASYFTAFSSLEIPFLIKGYTALIPMQALALLYVLYWHRQRSR